MYGFMEVCITSHLRDHDHQRKSGPSDRDPHVVLADAQVRDGCGCKGGVKKLCYCGDKMGWDVTK